MPTRKTFVPSDSVKQRISKWEGAAMTGSSIDPLSKKWVKQNNSFENEAALFSSALPESIRNHVLSNQDLADNLFSYSYNVGSGKFKRRVVPALVKYFNREGTSQDIADAMVAQGDTKLKGLKNRREQEKSGVLSAIPSRFNYGISFPLTTMPAQPDALRVTTPYPTQVDNTFVTPTIVPDDYVKAHQVTMEEDWANRAVQRIEAAKKYDTLMQSIGMFNNTTPQFTAPYSVSPYAEGGRINTTSKWDTLSMAQKAKMIKVAVGNGITDLNEIKQKYNEFAEGGGTDTDWSYNSWKKQIAEYMGIKPDEDITYDYEAYFKKYPEEAWKMLKGDPTAHFSDEFKTVYHPTFSSKSVGNDGSIYSGVKNPKTNPQGLVGGTWSPDYHTFTMSSDGYRGPVSMDDRKWYLENAEDNGVQLREANGSLPIYDGIPWGGVLPSVTVYGKKHSIGGPLVEDVMNEYKDGGGIHIKDSKKGTFTAAAKKHGKSVQAFASQVLAHPENYSPAMRKKANFARNAAKWHGLGGNLFDGTTEGSQQMQIAPTDATTVGFLPYIAPIKPELSTDAAVKRAKHIYTNYNQAKDAPFGEIETPIRNFARSLYERGLSPWGAGMSNCTLTVSQWVDPTNPLNRTESIYNNPNKYNYTQILPDEAVPGNVVVARNPSNGTMHTMMIEGFADKDGVYDFEGKKYQYKKGEPLMVYSRGGHNDSAIRRGVPLSVYTAESEGKTDQKFFRYNYPNEVFLPELIIKPKKRK